MQTATQTTDTAAINFAAFKLSDLPKLGAEWPGQGGQFAGLVPGKNGAPDYLLILGPEHDGELPWQPANDWAAGLDLEGHKDFTLPTRPEQSILFGVVGDQFKNDWYWSNTQHAATSVFAWMQLFGNGLQFSYRKSGAYRARAVRRLIIQ